ncbi:MAG: methyltransferase domain-containing protein [Candidatus Bathyarchaeota archaeon]|nr:methyltransferase domain-containing protein [Candidatus Bathyarchaeota archaeon]
MTDEEIKEACCVRYGQVAVNPKGRFNFPVGKEFAVSIGYSKQLLDRLPESMVESFCGVNYPPSFKEMKKGDVVLDIGCGAGLDLYVASKIVGPDGKIIGIDFSAEMVDKARANMKILGVTNVEVKRAYSDKIPLEDESVDVVTSNGIYNLSPNKEAVFKEAYRVLKPSGIIALSEIVLKKPLEEEIRKTIEDWFRCIGGALPEKTFLGLMKKVGFTNIRVLSRGRNARTGHELAMFADIVARKP